MSEALLSGQPASRVHTTATNCADDAVPTVRIPQSDLLIAEHLKFLLQLFEIRAAVIHRDVFTLGMVVAEVLVSSTDHARAAAIIAEQHQTGHAGDWECRDCNESVPGTFDVCWNCGRKP